MKKSEYDERFEFVIKEIGLLAFCNDDDFVEMKEKFIFSLAEMIMFAKSKLLKLKRFDDD